MKKILILGVSGLLGRYVFEGLKQSSGIYDVLGQTRDTNSKNSEILDPVNSWELLAALNRVKPDVVINLVAFTDVDACEKNQNLAYLVNTHISETIAQWAVNNPWSHIIHISTDHFYDGPGYKVEGTCTILNAYAFSKYAAEMAVRNLKNVTIFRTNFFGKSLTPGRKSFSDWIFHALQDKQRINLASDLLFTPVSLGFLARLIRRSIDDGLTGIFNIGTRNGLSKLDFGINFAKSLNLDLNLINPCKAEDIGFTVPRPKDMRMNVGKIEDVWGMMPTLDDQICEVKKDYESI